MRTARIQSHPHLKCNRKRRAFQNHQLRLTFLVSTTTTIRSILMHSPRTSTTQKRTKKILSGKVSLRNCSKKAERRSKKILVTDRFHPLLCQQPRGIWKSKSTKMMTTAIKTRRSKRTSTVNYRRWRINRINSTIVAHSQREMK